MAQNTLAQRKEEIIELLRDTKVKTIVLVGESGIGKTWTAREITRRAIKDDLFEFILWVFLNREYDSSALHDSIARQLCLLPTAEEGESEDDKEEAEKEENGKALQQQIYATLEGKRFLIILDDEGNKMDEKRIMSELETLRNISQQSSCKVLITSVSNHINTETKKVYEVKPLSMEESFSLLQERAGTSVEVPGIKSLAETLIEKARRLPAAVLVLAKALRQHDSGVRLLESALEEASDNERYNITQLLCTGYGMLPLSVLIDCCWHGSPFFRKGGSIHYNELIAYWMVEGYLGHIDCIEKAYEKGHHTLMELIDYGILKKVEADYIIMEGAMMNLDDYHCCGFGGVSSLGLANVFVNSKWEGLGKITWADGMIKTLCAGKQGHKPLTLLLDGTRLGREVPDNFFDSKQDLRVLALFNPTLKSLPSPLDKMVDLRVLVLRGCEFLEKIDHTQKLKNLTVLEISGATSLKTIPNDFPDDLFQHMPHLQSLNMSAVQIDKLPSSIYELSELCWLILKGCSRLATLESLRKLNKLVVLDLSGATSLKTFKDKTFGQNKELKMLDLSQTQIKSLPKLLNLGDLTHLSLSGCKVLDRLPSLQSLSSLQKLDLSGAEKFNEFHEHSLKNSADLKILDLSETAVKCLPSNISNLHRLFLRRCSQLKSLSGTEGLNKDLEILDLAGTHSLVEIAAKFFEYLRSLRILNLSETNIKALPSIVNLCNLRQLDLSGCSALTTIEDKSFEHMSRLQKLDLSGTKIEYLPSLSNCSNLRHLLLKKCTNVKVLPQIESLSKLEELNLCGINSLKEARANFFEKMGNLQILDLSETQLEQLPSMENLKNLRQLSLRGCPHLKMVLELEALTKLEILDLSGTAVDSLPAFNDFSNLRSLMLTDCFCLKDFLHLKVLDLLGATEVELPYGISKLTCLDHLDLPNMDNIQKAESENVKAPLKDPNRYQWSLSGLPVETFANNVRSLISVSSTQFRQVLEKNPSLWETSFKQFHFCVHPVDGQNKNGDRFFCRNELIFRDIHLQSRQLVHWKEGRSLEICGFDHFPKGIEDVLSHTDCLLLIDNMAERWLSDLGASNLKVMKGCWIERCRQMESVFHAEETEDIAKVGENLEILGVSNAVSLKSICSGSLQCELFQNLKCLYLDCCPELSNVFSSSQPPVNLKVLHIKFCDKLETVVDQMSPDHPGLLKLDILHLLELPQLKSIGCKLPSLQTLKVRQCPKLQKLEEYINLAESLQILLISNVTDLRSIYTGIRQPECYKNLKTLILESCSMLVNVFSSPQPPMNLETLQIKSCDKLETLFEHSSSVDYTVPALHTLHLQKLLKLKKIGGKFPSLQNPIVNGCPNCIDLPVA
ncbi:putative disease resistance protein At4g19050 [Cornus florida]|uniref:putative disease resistance protein At4g19050 n=1 Tax=Cornus florida TaxID=4283 RepID=UPI0028A2DB23|nr:putative disease resistance protein At4g19050 [Cornus florida]XP_059660231.1 putative disease resistance protein At4g19050 [Cornus florida]XP_059660239.1 putative disease resistance protein At4g19050 [Cornus florida]XP_059660249.1 putative disease resistance protein At4g19050 [Cornus florida]XP_059660256.1 putative disease resistance protein At4g19050 [Cornus florida]XP_059660264.1 putative disease resistance protein At4g19050 [Cornus florida]